MKTFSIWSRKNYKIWSKLVKNRSKIGQKSVKIGQKSVKIGQNRYATYHDRSGQYLFVDFFDYRQKNFKADFWPNGQS